MNNIVLTYRHRPVTESDVIFIRQLIAEHPQASRFALSRLLCTAWNWVQLNGAPRDMLCRSLMLALHRAGFIVLPPPRYVLTNRPTERRPPPVVHVEALELQVPLAKIQPLDFRQVRRTPEEALFNSLIEQYHYLGYTQPVGEHLKYLIYAQGQPIACMAWSSSPRHLGARDRFIGWRAEARLKNIGMLAYNTRFLILPWVRVEHLASHILGRMAKILAADWLRLYGHPIYFLETFVDPGRFRGTCYKAANWKYLGDTTGRGKNAQTHVPNRSIKQVLGYPLVPDFRQRLSEMAPQ